MTEDDGIVCGGGMYASMSAAKGLLENGRAPVQKVAEAVGHEDAAFFRNVFKRHTGMTPADYRSRFGP